MTPATWSFIELLMSRMIFPPSVPGYRGYGRIGGRFYANVSVSMALEALIGISSRRFVALFGPVLGRLPPLEEIPRARLPRWKARRLMVPATLAMARRVNANAKRLPQFLAGSPGRCDRLRAEIEQTAEAAALADLWPGEVRPLLMEAADMLTAAGSADGTTLVSTPAKLAALVGEADAALLLSGQRAEGAETTSLASLGPVLGLTRLARGEIDRNAYTRQYGHRGPHEMELSLPRSAEDPGWIDDQLAAVAGNGRDAPRDASRDADALLAERDAARAASWQRLASQDPPKAYESYRALPPYPALIRGRFDPARWADDPRRRVDYHDGRAVAQASPGMGTDEVITGFPGAAGVVEGTARVLSAPEDGARLGDGEILVTTVTNIGWTPIFPRAGAVVTDVGAPLSHAAIVARELGIPAVVGCGDATVRLRSGDRVRVNGGAGTVEILDRA